MLNKVWLSLSLLSYLHFLNVVAEFTDCSQLPKPMNPHDCCNYPELFKQNAFDYCESTRSNGQQCFYECVFGATEIFRKNKFSQAKVEDYVDWVMKTDDVFSPLYKNAYRKCIDKVNDMKLNLLRLHRRNGCNPQPEMVFLCVQNEMFATCPSDHWKSDVKDCVSNKDFITNCIRDK